MPRLISRVFTNLSYSTSTQIIAVTLFLLLASLIGCSEKPQIRQYKISGKIPEVLRSSDRMLGAMIPQKPEVWFVKVVGPTKAVAIAETQIRDFIAKLTFKDGQPDLAEPPAGWNLGGKKPMRFATFLIDTPEAQLDVSISNLPLTEDWDQQVALNVNRWRGQMKLDPSTAKWAGAEPMKVAACEQDAVWVDLTGEMGAGPAMPSISGTKPPFADMAITNEAPAIETSVKQRSEQPAQPDDSSGIKYETPAGWRPGKMSMMRLAAFNIGPEASPAELTIIQAGGDLRGNVARWLGQVRGDTPPNDVVDEALKAAEAIRVSGRDGQRFILTGSENATETLPSGATAQAIDATIVPMENGMSLFIKATGPPQTLQAEKEHIGEFIRSVQL